MIMIFVMLLSFMAAADEPFVLTWKAQAYEIATCPQNQPNEDPYTGRTSQITGVLAVACYDLVTTKMRREFHTLQEAKAFYRHRPRGDGNVAVFAPMLSEWKLMHGDKEIRLPEPEAGVAK